MTLFLQNKVDAAAAMTYNELAQVLETKNPQTGKLYTLNELNVITMERAGTAMLEDGIFAQGSWLKDAKNQDIATRFLAASFKGWAYCRDHHTECVNIVLKAGTTLGRGHQTWQMNEINKLIWPAPVRGIGVMNPIAFARTAAIAKQFKVIKKAPSAGTYRTDLAKAANAMLRKQGVDPRPHLEGDGRQGHARRKVGSNRMCPGPARARPGASNSQKEAPMSVLIRNGRVVTAADSTVADVFVDGEKVALIGTSLDVPADREIDASGKYVLPGAIDPHTHLDMPFGGTVTIDDFTSGHTAAAFGGTTCHVDFCIQGQGQSFAEALAGWHAKREGKAIIDNGFHIAVTDLARRRLARGARDAPGPGDHLLQAVHGLQGRADGRRRDALPDDAGRRARPARS